MQTIHTTDKDGNKVIIRYEKEVVKPEEPKPDIEIDSYQKFRLCVRRSNEERQYANNAGDKRYEKALVRLLQKDRNQYLEYDKKLREEYAEGRRYV